MNSPGETSKSSNIRPCERITSLFPLGMSCRGRAESFARRLESKLRTLGSSQVNIFNLTLTHTQYIELLH